MLLPEQSSDDERYEKDHTVLEFWDSDLDATGPYSDTVYLRTNSPRLEQMLWEICKRAVPGLTPVVSDEGYHFWEFPKAWLQLTVPGVGYVGLEAKDEEGMKHPS